MSSKRKYKMVGKPMVLMPQVMRFQHGSGKGQNGGFIMGALAAHGLAKTLKPISAANKIMDHTGFSKKKGGKVLRTATGHLSGLTGYGKRGRGYGSSRTKSRNVIVV